MPTRWETFPIEVGGGLNTSDPPIQLGLKSPGSATQLVNFEPSIKGGYRRINGYAKWDTNAVTGTGQIFGVAFFDGSVIAVRNGNIYQSVGSGWSSIATGRTHTTKHRFTIIGLNGTRKLIGVDGSNYPYSWDGSSFVNINGTTDIQGATHVVEFKDHVFYSKGDLVVFSEPFDETGFTVADGAGTFRMKDEVTGMIVFRERLFIFSETEIKVLDGDSEADFRLTVVADDIGCIERDTIQEVGGDVMFMAADGLRLLGATERIGDFANAVTSKKIQDLITDFQDDYTQYQSFVIRSKSQYRITGFTSGRQNSTTEGYIATFMHGHDVSLEMNAVDGFEWSQTKGIKAYSADSRIYAGDEYIVFCDETDYVYRLDQETASNFDGTAISSSYHTPFLSINDPTMRKTIHHAGLYLNPEGDVTGTLSLKFDLANASKIQPASIPISASGGGFDYGTAVFGTSTYADAANADLKLMTVGSGFNVQLQFAFTADEAPFIIDTIMLEYSTEDRR